MKLYCEVVVGEVLPSLRALITNELIQQHKMTQTQVAKKLGLTQPAISQYGKYLRGEKVKELQKNKKLMEVIKAFSKDISSGKFSSEIAVSKMLEISHMIVDKKIIYSPGISHNVPCEVCFK